LTAGDWSAKRPDLALSTHEGATIQGNRVSVIVHNIGSRPSPVSKAALMRGGQRIAEASIPAIAAPLDLSPRTAKVSFVVPDAVKGKLRVVVDSDDEVAEITELNNTLITIR
jgi:subtilase family serine protease